MKKAILPLALLASFCLVFSVSCGNSVQAPSGELPTWKVGDTWTVRQILKWPYEDESVTDIVYSVTGEQVYNGIDCYIVNRQVTHYNDSTIPESIDTMTQAYDKTTLRVIGFESSANSSWYSWGTWNCSIIAEYNSINYSVKPYPLSIGKAWTTTENETMTCLLPIPIGMTPIPTRNSSLIYRVEGIETVTVTADTFNCFKIVIYNSENEPLETEWVTDATRGFPVKRISNQIDFTVELTSYSLSE